MDYSKAFIVLRTQQLDDIDIQFLVYAAECLSVLILEPKVVKT